MSREYFQAMADKWEQAGRPAGLLPDNRWVLMALTSWTVSDGARAEGVSPEIRAFEKAALRQMKSRSPAWWDNLMRERHYCESCGERYRLENLHNCSKCMRVYCTWCRPRERAANGNPLHFCGGEIVG
ncbi:MAG: hypothetical protein KIT17_00965 [Rubrivivax sp.]|nr:hypothetical protein [Rubrivivax sp.]